LAMLTYIHTERYIEMFAGGTQNKPTEHADWLSS